MLSPQGELKVYHVENIEFIHDHKFQTARVDKAAVRARYSEERIRQSHNYIEEKFDVDFDHSWEWWSKKQVTEMAGKSPLGKIKDVVLKYTGLGRNK
ncbi:MAG: hypothetical protein M3040_09745 [Bacteroidota bacterium]|nr:hypothetical protein [Bacteroidota bacterium]